MSTQIQSSFINQQVLENISESILKQSKKFKYDAAASEDSRSSEYLDLKGDILFEIHYAISEALKQ